MSKTERIYRLIGTSYVSEKLAIFILLLIWQNYMSLGELFFNKDTCIFANKCLKLFSWLILAIIVKNEKKCF